MRDSRDSGGMCTRRSRRALWRSQSACAGPRSVRPSVRPPSASPERTESNEERERERQISRITGDNETEGERAMAGRNAKDREGIWKRIQTRTKSTDCYFPRNAVKTMMVWIPYNATKMLCGSKLRDINRKGNICRIDPRIFSNFISKLQNLDSCWKKKTRHPCVSSSL